MKEEVPHLIKIMCLSAGALSMFGSVLSYLGY